MLRATPPPRWLWIGNSNTRPFVTEFDNEFRKFKLCMKSKHYKGEIDSAPDNCDNLTFSGIDTIVADLGKNKTAEQLEAELDKIFSTLESYRLQSMKIIVEPLLPWKRHPESLRRVAVSAFKTIKNKFPGILIPPKPDFIKFTADGVHLTDRAGAKLYKLMYELSVDFFEQKDDNYQSGMDTGDESEVSTLAEEEIKIIGSENVTQKNPVPMHSKQNKQSRPKPGAPVHPGKPSRRPNVTPRSNPRTVNIDDDDKDEGNAFSLTHPDFRKFVKDFASLKSQVIKRWSVDLLVSARTKEDLDNTENEKNMNKIVFSGVEIHDLWAADLTWVIRLEKNQDRHH